MKLRDLLIATVAAIVALASTSCKKDNADSINKALLDGQWMCGYFLYNYGLEPDHPYLLFDVDAADNKISIYHEEGVTLANAPLIIKGRRMTFTSKYYTEEYDIVSLDQTHMTLRGVTETDLRFDVFFFKINALFPGAWAITWDMDEDVTRYYRFDEDGTGAALSPSGLELAALKWWTEPLTDCGFRFVLSVPTSNYENSMVIYMVLSDNKFEGYDEDHTPLRFNRLK